jgi:hypothetical protein
MRCQGIAESHTAQLGFVGKNPALLKGATLSKKLGNFPQQA